MKVYCLIIFLMFFSSSNSQESVNKGTLKIFLDSNNYVLLNSSDITLIENFGFIIKNQAKLDKIKDKISFVIRFMAGFSMATGWIVLLSSVLTSKNQRIKESILLRTLGASRKQILAINAIEYFIGRIAFFWNECAKKPSFWSYHRFCWLCFVGFVW